MIKHMQHKKLILGWRWFCFAVWLSILIPLQSGPIESKAESLAIEKLVSEANVRLHKASAPLVRETITTMVNSPDVSQQRAGIVLLGKHVSKIKNNPADYRAVRDIFLQKLFTINPQLSSEVIEALPQFTDFTDDEFAKGYVAIQNCYAAEKAVQGDIGFPPSANGRSALVRTLGDQAFDRLQELQKTNPEIKAAIEKDRYGWFSATMDPRALEIMLEDLQNRPQRLLSDNLAMIVVYEIYQTPNEEKFKPVAHKVYHFLKQKALDTSLNEQQRIHALENALFIAREDSDLVEDALGLTSSLSDWWTSLGKVSVSRVEGAMTAATEAEKLRHIPSTDAKTLAVERAKRDAIRATLKKYVN